MNIKDYFAIKSKNKLLNEKKFTIYSDFMELRDKKSIFLKFSFYSKVVVYTIALFFLINSLYGNFPINIPLTDDVKVQRWLNVVSAWSIGKIVKFEWDFKIQQSWKDIVSDEIFDNDILILWERSTLTFTVNSWINSYIIWPARLQIKLTNNEDGNNKYVFYMMDGTYLNVRSNKENNYMLIKAEQLEIIPDTWFVNLTLSSKNWNRIVENNWDDITVKKELTKNIKNSKIVNLTKNEKLIILEDKKIKAIKNTFDSNSKQYQLDNKWNIKIIANIKQISILNNELNENNIRDRIQKIVLWNIKWDTKKYDRWLARLAKDISDIYRQLDIVVDSEILKMKLNKWKISIDDVQLLIDQLISKLDNSFIIPWVYIDKLKLILWWIIIINNNKTECSDCKTITDFIERIELDEIYKKKLLEF